MCVLLGTRKSLELIQYLAKGRSATAPLPDPELVYYCYEGFLGFGCSLLLAVCSLDGQRMNAIECFRCPVAEDRKRGDRCALLKWLSVHHGLPQVSDKTKTVVRVDRRQTEKGRRADLTANWGEQHPPSWDPVSSQARGPTKHANAYECMQGCLGCVNLRITSA